MTERLTSVRGSAWSKEVTTEHADVLICPAEYNRVGFTTGEDFDLFVDRFVAGC